MSKTEFLPNGKPWPVQSLFICSYSELIRRYMGIDGYPAVPLSRLN